MSMTGWTESAENIEARKRRILQGTSHAARVQALLDRLFPGFTQAQRIARLNQAVTSFLASNHNMSEETIKALQELRAATASYKPFGKGV